MVKWKECKILKKVYVEHKDCFGFVLDELMFHKNGTGCYIDCANSSPFNTFQEGDYIEVDLDRVEQENMYYVFNDINVVRKVSSSNEMISRNNNNIPSISKNESRGIINVLNEAIDSDERNEYEAKVHVDSSGKYSGFSLIGRRK